jgi:hypothetical protein
MKLKTLIRFPKFAKNFKIHFNSLESLLIFIHAEHTCISENYAAIVSKNWP